MHITKLAPFGVWFYCDTCKTSCDPIKLYGEAYKISNAEDIVSQLKKDLKLKSINKTDFATYCNFHDTYYNKVQLIWEKARAYMQNSPPAAAIGRLNELNLWVSHEVFKRGLANWIGYLPKYELEGLLDDSVTGIGKYVEGVLIMPFYMKPGFICGYGVIGPKDTMPYVNMLTERACGFCGLIDSTFNSSNEVYVLPHPLQAARIHHKCAIENYNKLSVVAKGFVGELDCTSLKSNAIVWIDEPDDAFLKTCILSNTFKVMSEETPYIWKPAEKTSKLWQFKLMPSIHRDIANCKLRTPVDYFVSELLTLGLGKAKLVLEGMGITEFQKNVILSACSDGVRQEISDLLAQSVQSQPIIVDKRVVFEREDKIWVRGSREVADEMIANFTMRIVHVCRNKNNGNATLFGKIYLPMQEVSFQAEESDMENDPKKVVSTLLAAAGIPVQPYIAEILKKRFLDTIMRFSNPEVHTVQDFVGYDSDFLRFNLPLVSIDVEHLKVGMPFAICDEPIPCENLTMSAGDSITTVKHLFGRSIETAAYIATLACVATGIYNNIEQNTRTNTLLIGEKGSLAEYIFDVIRMDTGFIAIDLKSKKDMDLAKEVAVKHDVPVMINGLKSDPALLAKWLEGQGGNSIVLANSLYAAALGNDRDWHFVKADVQFHEETIKLLKSEYMFPFILQYMLTVRPSSAHQFLDQLDLLAKSIKVENTIIPVARRLVSEKGFVNANSASIHLMNFVQEGVESGLFKTYTGEHSKKCHIVIKNVLQDTVTINITNLIAQTRLNDLPSNSWKAAIEELKAIGAIEVDLDGKVGLMFNKPVWNSIITTVKRMKSARKHYLNSLQNVV